MASTGVVDGTATGEFGVGGPSVGDADSTVVLAAAGANLPGLVDVVHREVACFYGAWEEPTAALRAALWAVGCRAVRNKSCLRGADWLQLTP